MQVKLPADGFLYVKTPYQDKDFVQKVLNGVWSKREGMNRFPKNIQAMLELAKAYPDLTANPTFAQAYQQIKVNRGKLLALKSLTDCPGDPRLRPYQRVDVEYVSGLPAAGIFNEPRTGKTPTSILLIKKLGSKKNLIITPASLIWNWAKEFVDWAPDVKVFVAAGTPAKRRGIYADYMHTYSDEKRVLIISKDTWKGDSAQFDGFEHDTCFVDEARYLRALAGPKRGNSAQALAICKVKAKHRYAIDGTPTVKHSKDIFGILHFLYPRKFPSYWQFAERYFVVGQNMSTGAYEVGLPKPEREQELQEIIGFLSVQRKRKEVMPWLPDKERVPFLVKMEGKQAKLYKQMADDFMAIDEDDDHMVDTANVLAQLMRLRQICLDPRLLGFDAESAKTKALLEWLDNNREPVIVMTMFTSYLLLIKPEIEALGLRVGLLIGEGMTNTQKEQAKADFQAGKTDVLLCNIVTAGAGHTLDVAETVIFTDKAWNPVDNEQAEDRVTPVTEDRNHKHTILTFQCQDSYDEKLNRINDMKKSLTDVINEGGREAIKKLLAGGV